MPVGLSSNLRVACLVVTAASLVAVPCNCRLPLWRAQSRRRTIAKMAPTLSMAHCCPLGMLLCRWHRLAEHRAWRTLQWPAGTRRRWNGSAIEIATSLRQIRNAPPRQAALRHARSEEPERSSGRNVHPACHCNGDRDLECDAKLSSCTAGRWIASRFCGEHRTPLSAQRWTPPLAVPVPRGKARKHAECTETLPLARNLIAYAYRTEYASSQLKSADVGKLPTWLNGTKHITGKTTTTPRLFC